MRKTLDNSGDLGLHQIAEDALRMVDVTTQPYEDNYEMRIMLIQKLSNMIMADVHPNDHHSLYEDLHDAVFLRYYKVGD